MKLRDRQWRRLKPGPRSCIFTLAIRVLPHPEVPFRYAFWGGALATGLWVLARGTYLGYLENVSKVGPLFGSLSAVVMTLVWVYASSLTFLLGAELTRWLIVTTKRVAHRHAISSRRWVREVREDLIDPSPDAQANLDRLELLQQLESGLRRLDGRCERLLRALFLTGRDRSYGAVAQRLGMKANSVGPTRLRCLERLREIMEETRS